MANKRITEQTTDSALVAGDYVIVDSQSEGTRKFDLGGELTDLRADLGDLTDLDTTDKSSIVNAINEVAGGSGSGLTADIKQALLQIAQKVAYIDDDGQDYYDALEEALYPPANLVSISAVYTQTKTIGSGDSLNKLKSDLVVTAYYDDSSTEVITNYTLSGTLTEGASTITVSYDGKTTTFSVNVAHTSLPYIKSTGSQYINTNLILDFYDEVEITLQDDVETDVDVLYWGVTDGSSAGNHRVAVGPVKNSTKNNYSARWTGDAAGNINQTRVTGVICTLSMLNNSATVKTFKRSYEGGTDLTLNTSNDNANNMPQYPIYIFARNQAGTAQYNSAYTFYEMVIKNQSGTERMHLLPVSKNSVLCLYDTVSGAYFTNSGSGNFTYE